MRLCVYAASSAQVHPEYQQTAYALGETLAKNGHSLVYGGGSTGLMGAVADGALAHGGEVIGILPKFMADLEWGHPGLTELQLVEDMRERKHRLLTDSDAVVALPGGCGTLEELFEAITLIQTKKIGKFPIILVGTKFWSGLIDWIKEVLVEREHTISPEDLNLFKLVDTEDEVVDVLDKFYKKYDLSPNF